MKKRNVLKFIKKIVSDMINDPDGSTVLRVGHGSVQIDRSTHDRYTEFANISFPSKYDESEDDYDEDLEAYVDRNDPPYKCTGAAVVNMANIFGGVYAAAFVVREGSKYDTEEAVGEELNKCDPDWYEVVKIEGAIMNNPVAKMCAQRTKHAVTMMMQMSPNIDDMFLILCYYDVMDYNWHFYKEGPKNTKKDVKLSLSYSLTQQLIRQKCAGENIISPAINGIIDAIISGYDESLVDQSDADKIDDQYFIPTTCKVLHDGKYAEDLCYELLEKEKLVIGETIKDICGLEYLPEVPDCCWTDVPYISRLKKKFKKLFELGCDGAEKVFKLRLLHVPLNDESEEVN